MEYQKPSSSDVEITNNPYNTDPNDDSKSLLSVQQLQQQLNLIIRSWDSKEVVDIEEEVLSDFDSDCDSIAMDKHYCEEFSDGESGKKDLEELLHNAQKIPTPVGTSNRENSSEDAKDYPLKYQTAPTPTANTKQKPTASHNPLRKTQIQIVDPKLKDFKTRFCTCCQDTRIQYTYSRMRRHLNRLKRLERFS